MGNIKELVSFKSMFINLKQTCSGRKLHEHNYYEGSRHICLSGGPTLTFSFFLSAERGFVVAEYVYLQQSFCLFKNAFNLLIYRQTQNFANSTCQSCIWICCVVRKATSRPITLSNQFLGQTHRNNPSQIQNFKFKLRTRKNTIFHYKKL